MLQIKQKLAKALGKRSSKVVNLFVQGKTDKEIASALNCSNEVVAYHINKLKDEVKATNRSQIWPMITIQSLLDENSVCLARSNLLKLELQIRDFNR